MPLRGESGSPRFRRKLSLPPLSPFDDSQGAESLALDPWVSQYELWGVGGGQEAPQRQLAKCSHSYQQGVVEALETEPKRIISPHKLDYC